MRLRTKILLSVIPTVGTALLLTGWLVINSATKSSHDAVYQYCEGVLDAYFTQDLASRVELLKKNQLENVASFVDRFQQEALAAAGQLHLVWPGHLFIVDDRKSIVFCSSNEMSDRLPESWNPILERLVGAPDRVLKGHLPDEGYGDYVAKYFKPWNWGVVIVIKGDFLHEREQRIWITVASVGVITSIALILSLGMLLHRFIVEPVISLRGASQRIAMEESPVSIPVKDGDEFGELSRDIEGMSYHIHQSRKALREAYDDLKRVDEMKTVLLSNVSHELRTPLTSIMGFAKLWLKKIEGRDPDIPLSAKQMAALRDALNVISEQGNSMTGLIDNIVVLMALTADDVVAEMHPHDMVNIVEKVSNDLRERIEAKGLSFVLTTPSEPVPIKADNKLIELVLKHYITNAVAFTPAGEIEVRVAVNEDGVMVEVCDTGVGLSPEDAAKVFEQFHQAGDVMTEKPKGLGLGLAICRKIVRLHGGQVGVRSRLGKGSVFFFSLPCVDEVG
ncbi:HAMP domain-containing sensor histidine kinase [uncultured Pseudodesulfovibrio sp.]|uniref:HAMP domain-containing sensor histidine kinase n=1 Tax=uncultured Pseudodesulfovibrio sp. TaxID=2035858 RepID=UPI0029C6C96A|nr:HAMP domain-containing sensor histidine kinase [uncultured Pseudodesulfovibrio sp.]